MIIGLMVLVRNDNRVNGIGIGVPVGNLYFLGDSVHPLQLSIPIHLIEN